MRKLLLVTILIFIPQLARAENTPPSQTVQEAAQIVKGDFKSLKHVATGRVDRIIDQQTVLLKDGKIVRLLGLEYPLGTDETPPEEPFLAKEALEKMLPETTEVMLYQKRNQTSDVRRGRVNRMGHLLAHLVKKDNEEWVNGTVISQGLAWVVTDSSNPEMASQMYGLEEKARTSNKGLWTKDSTNGLLTADTAAKGEGQFRVVEGTISRSATSKNNLYLNFGTDWKKDFTVMITPSLRKALARSGTDPMSLSGKTVRVRGWIRQWNGPFMELETPERLEIVTTSRPSTEPPTESSTAPVEKPSTVSQPIGSPPND